MTKTFLLALAPLAITSVGAPASEPAQRSIQPDTQVAVPFADLDLTTARGIRVLDARLSQAAEALCPRDPGIAELARHRVARQCITAIRASVEQHVADAVTAARQGHAEALAVR